MLFLYPMWDNESERLGLKRCTSLGYALRCVAELLGFVGLLILIILAWNLGILLVKRSFCKAHLYLLLIPFGIGIISEIIYQIGYMIARHKNFDYNYEKTEASWIENGDRKTYKYQTGDK